MFTFSKVFKTWRKGQKAPSIDFKIYDLDEYLCVCKTIDQYLERTKSRRDKHRQLLIRTLRYKNDRIGRQRLASEEAWDETRCRLKR